MKLAFKPATSTLSFYEMVRSSHHHSDLIEIPRSKHRSAPHHQQFEEGGKRSDFGSELGQVIEEKGPILGLIYHQQFEEKVLNLGLILGGSLLKRKV